MKAISFNSARATILGDPGLREIYYQEGRRLAIDRKEREAIEQAAADQYLRMVLRQQRRKELERLLSQSPVEAWMSEHEEDITSENAPTRGALRELVRMDRLRLKAARERLRGVGIK